MSITALSGCSCGVDDASECYSKRHTYGCQAPLTWLLSALTWREWGFPTHFGFGGGGGGVHMPCHARKYSYEGV